MTVIAIDGPSGSGKSTVSQRVAARLGLRYLDSGALYRATALALSQREIPAISGPGLAAGLDGLHLQISDHAGPAEVQVDGEDVSAAIRTIEVTAAVSAYAALPEVRSFVGQIAREVIGEGGIVIEGRDIGSVVAPRADVKVYLTATADIRAKRRLGELEDATFDLARSSVVDRDLKDSTRSISPLTQVSEATLIDSSEMGIDDVVDAIVALADQERA